MTDSNAVPPRDPNFPPPLPPASVYPAPLPPPVPPVPAKRRGLRILAAISLILLAFSVMANVILLVMLIGVAVAGSAGTSSGRVVEETVKEGGREKIVILPAVGTVDEEMVERVRKFIDAVKEDASIKAVVVEVDSPGGSITASDEIHHLFTELSKKLPVTVAMRGLAASGGYYISMPAQKIYAEPTTITGSIGVIWPAFEFSGLLEKIGVKPEIITSDQAVFKDAASPFKKFTPQDVEYIKGLVNQAHTRFSDIVQKGRDGKLKEPMNKIAIGRVWTADDALKLGLIDKIAYEDDAVSESAEAAGIRNPTVVRLREHISVFDALGVASNMGKGKIELSPKMIYELQNPKMEYRYIPPTVGQQ